MSVEAQNWAPTGKGSEREKQEAYWKEHTKEATMEAMMLDTQAAEIDKLERPEVLSLLGPVDGKRVVELGAGIGRFTASLAESARKVWAFDFMDSLTKQNRESNGHLPNVEIIQQDVTKLEMPGNSCDVVFSNWLLMYLSDDEVGTLAQRALSWITTGGIMFFRESCFGKSGDMSRTINPSHYRNPNAYFQIFDGTSCTDTSGKMYKFELVNACCVGSYVTLKNNQNQITWKWRKVETSPSEINEFRHFLDESQYSMQGILRYERMFGAGFVSSGGLHTAQELLARTTLRKGEAVLDVGSGIGGAGFYMAKNYGVRVVGVDLSVNMFIIALERSRGSKADVCFEVADITKRKFPRHSFDFIHSRDTLLHIEDKPTLFDRLFEVLKPGGRLLITDYCQSELKPSENFAAYIKQRGYTLFTVSDYGEMLRKAGFVNVTAEDATNMFETNLRRELSALERSRDSFLADFSESDYFSLHNGWREKLERVAQGEQRWGVFLAEKI